MEVDKKAVTQWKKSCISLRNYQEYIARKDERSRLTLIDLLYIRNFKGGNSTINESEQQINDKLIFYSKKLINIEREFGKMILSDLNKQQIEKLTDLIMSICNLTSKNSATQIDGFSVSFLSALIHAYYPELIPILDRRVLTSIPLIVSQDIDSQGQIRNIQRFYKPLIEYMAITSKDSGYTIREIDRQLFIRRIVMKNTFNRKGNPIIRKLISNDDVFEI